ncbi:MAG: 50S ribosomal protein L21 [Acidimicrobiales bacterium]
MYAVVNIGGKQERVSVGDVIKVEYLGEEQGSQVELDPVLLVAGDDVRTLPGEMEQVRVGAVVVGEALGKKIRGFTYKPKTRSRRRYGHRQRYSLVEIESMVAPGIEEQRILTAGHGANDASASDKQHGEAGKDVSASPVVTADGDGE